MPYTTATKSIKYLRNLPNGSDDKASAYDVGDPSSVLGQEDLLEKEMATHSSILAWRTPRTKEPGGLWSMGSHRVKCDGATNTLTFFTVD